MLLKKIPFTKNHLIKNVQKFLNAM